MRAAGPVCSIPRHWDRLALSLSDRRDQLLERLAQQVEALPADNESWLSTERELMAAESALRRLQAI